MTNPVKTVTKQVQRLQVKMTLTYAILGLSISAILRMWRSSNQLYSSRPGFSSAEPYELISLTTKYIKYVRKTGVWGLESWEFTNGSSSETINTK